MGFIIRLSHNSTFSSAKRVVRIIRNEPVLFPYQLLLIAQGSDNTCVLSSFVPSSWTELSDLTEFARQGKELNKTRRVQTEIDYTRAIQNN